MCCGAAHTPSASHKTQQLLRSFFCSHNDSKALCLLLFVLSLVTPVSAHCRFSLSIARSAPRTCLKHVIFTCRMNSFVTLLKDVSNLAGSSIPPFTRDHFTSGVGTPFTTALKMAFLPLERSNKLVIQEKLEREDTHARPFNSMVPRVRHDCWLRQKLPLKIITSLLSL